MIYMSKVFFFFFFKQKTAYEMRISDWSSDVCSSDLHQYVRFYTSTGAVILDDALNPLELASPYTEDQLFHIRHKQGGDTMFLLHENVFPQRLRRLNTTSWALGPVPWITEPFGEHGIAPARRRSQLGRATCREGVCKYV